MSRAKAVTLSDNRLALIDIFKSIFYTVIKNKSVICKADTFFASYKKTDFKGRLQFGNCFTYGRLAIKRALAAPRVLPASATARNILYKDKLLFII